LSPTCSSIQRSSISSCSGVNPTAPSTPKPPACDTAATTSRQWVNAKIGNSMSRRSQSSVCMGSSGGGAVRLSTMIENGGPDDGIPLAQDGDADCRVGAGGTHARDAGGGQALRARQSDRAAVPRRARARAVRDGLLLGSREEVLAGARRLHDGG